jgi:phospholipase/carboxylesterase
MRWLARATALLALVFGCTRNPPRQRTEPVEPTTTASAATAVAPEVSTPPHATLTHATLTLGGSDDEPLPWVVALHGLGDTPHDFVQLLSPSGVRAHVYAPRALFPYGDGFDWFQVRVGGDPERLAAALRRAMTELVRFVDERAKEPHNVGKPVLVGFSQGGMLSFALGAHHPELFRLVVPVAGLLPESLWPEQKPSVDVPIVALHGSADPVVPIGPARALTARLEQLGYQATLLEFEGVTHSVPPEERARLFEIVRSNLER